MFSQANTTSSVRNSFLRYSRSPPPHTHNVVVATIIIFNILEPYNRNELSDDNLKMVVHGKF